MDISVAQLMDKNIDRLTETLSTMGPQATWMAQEMVGRYALEGWGQLILGSICIVLVITFAVYAAKQPSDDCLDHPAFIMGCVFSFFATIFAPMLVWYGFMKVMYPEAGLLTRLLQ
jgi:hypothetical protein